ncbi:MAG: hypothetical protein JNM84_22605 [Planctomycetes bacterium]|nr:hypothetical protein [Planctomycetota bacterium]
MTFPARAAAQTPPNDECAAAIVLSQGLQGPFHNAGATASIPDWLCRTDFPDVWFTYVPTVSGEASFAICGLAGFELAAEMLYGTCSGLTSHRCTRVYCSTVPQPSVPTIPGRAVFLRVGGAQRTTGSFTIEVRQYLAPTNDECAGALPLALGPNGPFTTEGASPSESWGSSYPAIDADVWFRYRATITGELLLSPRFALTDIALAQGFRGTCSQRTATGISRSYSGPNDALRVPIFRGEDVLLRFAFLYGNRMSFTLEASEIASPSNDECSGAFVLREGANGPFFDAGSTPSGPFACAPPLRDTWFRFTPTLASSITSFDLRTLFSPDLVLELYDGDCAAPQVISCVTPRLNGRSFITPTHRDRPLLLRLAFSRSLPQYSFTLQVTERPKLSQHRIPTGCAGAEIEVSGVAAPGQQLTFRTTYPRASTLAIAMLLGAPQRSWLQLCPEDVCVLGVDPWIVLASRELSLGVPYTPWAQGLSFAVQGVALRGALTGCASANGLVQVTDTLLVNFP